MSEKVPEGWEMHRLQEICDGISVGHVGSTAEHYTDFSGVKFIRTGDLKNGKIRFSNTKYISNEFHKKLSKSQLRPGDILVSRVGDTGQAALVPKEIGEANCANIIIIKPAKGIYPEFLLSNINSEDFFNQTAAVSIGSAQAVLNISVIKNLKTLIPPLPEQKKIASILTSVDDVIETTQKQIDKLQDLKKATMNELLTKGIGHTEFKDSELGRIPKSWEVKSLAKICEVSSSKRVMQSDYADEGVPFYRSKEIIIKSKGDKVQSVLYIPEEQFLNLASKFGAPASGDILITAVGTIGVCYLVGQEKFYFKDGNLLWLKRIKKLMPSFLSVYLSIQSTRERIIEISGGSSQSALTIEKLSDFLVPIPSQCEQDKFSKIAKSLGERIDSQKQKLAQTQSLKKSLMQDLLTGKVRVQVN